jgi:hypothetical protein
MKVGDLVTIPMRTGDIVKLLSSNERKLIVETRDEIVPSGSGLRLKIMFRLAGDDFANRWFSRQEVDPWILRRHP